MEGITWTSHNIIAQWKHSAANMDGESEIFWLAEAEVLAKLGADAHKLRVMLHPKMKEEKPYMSVGK